MATTATTPFNSQELIEQLVQMKRITWRWPVLMLFSRFLLFAGFQALIALVLYLSGSAAPWLASVAWWPIVPVFANLVVLFLLNRLFRAEGSRLIDLYKFQRGEVGKEMTYFPTS